MAPTGLSPGDKGIGEVDQSCEGNVLLYENFQGENDLTNIHTKTLGV